MRAIRDEEGNPKACIQGLPFPANPFLPALSQEPLSWVLHMFNSHQQFTGSLRINSRLSLLGNRLLKDLYFARQNEKEQNIKTHLWIKEVSQQYYCNRTDQSTYTQHAQVVAIKQIQTTKTSCS